MVFSSILFLCYFLVIVLVVYGVTPPKARNLVLLIASLVFYFYGEPRFGIVMVGTAILGYLFGLGIDKANNPGYKKLFLVGSIVVCLMPLLFFKYGDFFLENGNRLFHQNVPLLGLALPVGISFYTFQVLSYVIDVYRGDAKVQKNPLHFVTYVTLFPQLIAGPIVRYQSIAAELEKRELSLCGLSNGMRRFTIGLGKKVILADSLAEIIRQLTLSDTGTVLSSWICAVAFTFQIYYDFSGYSDMAIGLGRMFGFSFCENFDYPFVSGSITEFWRRWHISLGSWFRDYVYIPLGGNRCSKGRWLFHILIVWGLTGFWHGAAWNFILWGLYFAILLVAEKLFLGKVLKKLPYVFRVCYVMLLVVLGFVLFQAETLGAAWHHVQGMFAFENIPFINATTTYYLLGNLFFFFLAALGATPIPARWIARQKETRIGDRVLLVLEPLFVAATLLVSIAYLVDGTFHPFLYFRF